MKAWLERNRIYIEVVSLLCIPVVSIAFVAMQHGLMEKQTRLMTVQNEIARRQLAPKFLFRYQMFAADRKNASPSRFLISKEGPEARNLRGHCVAYLELDVPGAGKRRIELDGFYTGQDEETIVSENLYYYHPQDPEPLLVRQFWETVFSIEDRGRRNLSHYVELRYFNAINEECVERMIVPWEINIKDEPVHKVIPVEKQPEMHRKVSLKVEKGQEKRDYLGIVKDLQAAIESLKQEAKRLVVDKEMAGE